MPRTEKGHMIDHTVTSFLWGSQWPVCRIVQFSWFMGLKNVTNHLHNNKLFGKVILKNPILRATQNTQCWNSPSITGTITGIVYCGQLKINPYFFLAPHVISMFGTGFRVKIDALLNFNKYQDIGAQNPVVNCNSLWIWTALKITNMKRVPK